MEVTNNYNASMKTKMAVLTGTALSSGAYIAHLLKGKQGNVFQRLPQLELGIKESIGLCTISTLSGLLTGLLFDEPKHKKDKLKEGVNQLIGNTLVPLGSLALVNNCTKGLSKISQTLIALFTLFSTTVLGHKLANKVNEKVFKEKSIYKCSAKDFVNDTDDILFVVSTVLKSKPLYNITACICPFTYLAQGYLAGCRQKDKKTLDKYI